MIALSPVPSRAFTRAIVFSVFSIALLAAAAAPPDARAQRPYAEVVPRSAETDRGLFHVHEVAGTRLFEIPDSLLGRDMALLSRLAGVQHGLAHAGDRLGPNLVVRWERRGDRVLLRAVSHETTADAERAVYRAVEQASLAPILASFTIEARGDASSVIDVTDLYTSDVPAFSPARMHRQRFGIRGFDRDRSYVEWVRSFPTNVEVRAVLTYAADDPPSEPRGGTVSLAVNHSMVLLPAEPMRPRLYDERVGYISTGQLDYGLDYQGAKERHYIRRFRLEPSDPEAFRRGELVEPVEPIVWYIDPATPPEWIPYFEAGVLEWNEAFEQAGFRNAIQVRVAPTEEEDPEFSLLDARYSVIRYVASPLRSANATGDVVDPRSGEVIRGHINMYHGLMSRLRWWLVSQVAARDEAARGVRMPDSLMGEALRYVVSHEMAHAVGLPHNQRGNHAFPTDSLRSPSFIEQWGHAASVVGRTRFNYVAQPGDGIPELERRRVGVWDKFAVMWGYRPILEATSPDDEAPVLHRWVLEHADRPWFHFGGGQFGADEEWDPYRQTESMGDDLVRSSELGLANLKRVLPNLVDWLAVEGADYSELEAHYLQVLTQWARYVQHNTTLIGGVYTHHKRFGEPGPVYTSVTRAEQRRAMAWLDANAFATPGWLLDKELLRRLEHAGNVERLRAYQVGAVNALLNANRLARLIEQEAWLGDAAYRPVEMLDDLRGMIWRELADGRAVDTYRRNLQRGYLERLHFLMHEAESDVFVPPPSGNLRVGRDDDPPLNAELHVGQSDIRPLVREQLTILIGEIEGALHRTRDRVTIAHLVDALARIDATLGARAAPPARREVARAGGGG